LPREEPSSNQLASSPNCFTGKQCFCGG
jgi:hypothetical protein